MEEVIGDATTLLKVQFSSYSLLLSIMSSSGCGLSAYMMLGLPIIIMLLKRAEYSVSDRSSTRGGESIQSSFSRLESNRKGLEQSARAIIERKSNRKNIGTTAQEGLAIGGGSYWTGYLVAGAVESAEKIGNGKKPPLTSI